MPEWRLEEHNICSRQERDTVKWEGRYADVFSKQYSVCLECNIHEEK